MYQLAERFIPRPRTVLFEMPATRVVSARHYGRHRKSLEPKQRRLLGATAAGVDKRTPAEFGFTESDRSRDFAGTVRSGRSTHFYRLFTAASLP